MPTASLECVSPVALVKWQRRSHYVGATSAGTLAVIASFAIYVGVGYVGLLCAILVAPTFVLLCFAAPRARWVQRAARRVAREHARARRESLRQHELGRLTAGRQEQYVDLRGLVDDIERTDPVRAVRLELQELLDYFVQLAVGHHHCRESLRVTGGSESQATMTIFGNLQRRGIAARRLRHREETTARLARIGDEIDCADDFIRLVAQRTACSSLDTRIDGQGEIDKRLTELDEVKAALVRISI